MAGDPEKATGASRESSHRESTDEHDLAIKEQNGGEVPTPSEDEKENIKKLDSKIVKVDIKDEDIYAHLPAHEATVLKRQVEIPEVKAGWGNLYRYSTTNDIIIMVISAICSIAAGAALPLMTVVFGQLAGEFNGFFQGTKSQSELSDTIVDMVLYFVYIGIAEFVTVYISTVGFIYVGEHISGKIRAHYLEACMRQNIGFFDKLGSGEVTTRITADTNLVQDGISEKVGLTLTATATFITAFVIGFIKSWKLTLILSSTVFAIAFTMGGGSSFIIRYSKQSIESYALGGSVAEEVISSIRNAIAFGTQDKLSRQYDDHLKVAETYGYKNKFVLGIMIGCMFLILYLNYGLGFWMGSVYLVKGEVSLSSILTILMSIMIGAFSIGNVAPNAQAFTTAISAAAKIFNTIDRVSPLDPTNDEGIKLDHVEGTIELRNIKHIYPSRPEVTVMQDVSLIIPAGKKTALVGASGSGKSTIVGLVERFYDPVGGQVFLDGHDLSTVNLRWLRQQISLVSQEPTLFGTTIFENIAHGLIGTKYQDEKDEKRKELIIEAAKMANAHDFISTLPEGYETNVGERGFLLSGGQKQRIAIARAMVSDPKILLLDEATSALDTKSEGVVQAALEVAAAGRTTITIAHRLSTIKEADNIVVMSEGRIVEQGTHDELLAAKGAYHGLVEAQKIAETRELTPEEEARRDAEDEKLMKIATTRSNKSGNFSEDPDDKNIASKLNRTATSKSQSSLALQNRKQTAEQHDSLWTLAKLIAAFNKKEWHIMLFGLFCSIICGGGNPVQAVFFAKEILSLSTPLSRPDGTPIPGAAGKLRSDVNFWSLMYLMLAFVQLLAFCGQGIAFAFCSERLIHRVRDRAFRTMLRQDIEFFDKEENTAGALTSFLSTQTTHVAGLSGVTLGTILSVITTLVAAIILSTAIAWKLSLVCISTIPVLLACGFFRFWLLAQFQARAKKAYEKSASYACEATSAIRTVASLTREEDVLAHYTSALNSQAVRSLHSILKSSLLYAASQSLMFACVALGFWYGGKRIASGEYTMFQFFVAFSSVIFGAQSAGTIFSFAPDMGKAKQAAQELKILFDRKPAIDTWSEEGADITNVEGTVEFRDVHFRYPTRPEQPVLRGLSLSVKPGQYIALVGASGCGKSTTIALLERFYDPLVGGIYVDGKEISSLNLNQYRSFIALVSQEPTLYQGTIRDNVLLGADRPDVPDSEIEFACREANIYDFIMSLPDGFSTIVGSKGSMLSGGQKQRIAIARALLRDPKILLLDEATSALDSESEHVVQAALDKAAKGRTTIAVAHRLSTIQKADVIYVFDQGVIVESGDHNELMNRGGRYSELVNLQSLGGKKH
ncbi:P-loop containing nucleoside triphosphate hydrolase protein [Bisporella sp. PMI_857]|nr:P-loop containing nucleoside triphosphate hydrolase protein [Bisporella sp. PMI_857]